MTLTHEHLFDNEGTVSQRRVEASFDVINAWKDISKDMRISGGFIIAACMVDID